MCTRPVRNAGVPVGTASRSRNPTSAAPSAPTTPISSSHQAPFARKPGSSTRCEATSNTLAATQAPIGTGTSTGCSGCPCGPASSALTGRLACWRSSTMSLPSRDRGVSPTNAGAIRPAGQEAGCRKVLGNADGRYPGAVDTGSPSGDDRTTASLAAVAALADELRRRMYEFIRQARRPVSREEAAARVGISRKLAAFHLDKLAEVGLLRSSFAPAGGIRKVGRTPKVYEPTAGGVHVSIPERHHDLLAGILVDAVLAEDGTRTAREAAAEIARTEGARIGAAERARLRPGRLGVERALTLITTLLAGHGFE